MNILDEYRRNAQECQRMAENAGNPADKASWLRLAASWLSMIKNDSRRPFADGRQRNQDGNGQNGFQKAWPPLPEEDSQASH